MSTELHVVLAGGDNGRGRGEGPLVVLLHGFGAPGDDLVSLHRALDVPAGVRFAFPAGIIDLSGVFGGDARAWWNIDLEARMIRAARGEPRDPNEIPEHMDTATASVVQWLDAYRAQTPNAPLILSGFSQGAMLALEIALNLRTPPNALALLSSTLLAQARQTPRLARLKHTPIFQSHGQTDAILPYADALSLHTHLKGAGLDASFLPFRGGHEIPGSVLLGLSALVQKAVTAGAVSQ
jgi:phospholipase/carboxylesterase